MSPQIRPAKTLKSLSASRRFRNRVIAQVLVCTVPTAVLLGIGKASFAGGFLWGIFGLMFVRLVILGKPAELLCLLIALSPLLNLMKEFAFTYQIITIVSALAVLHYASRSPVDFWEILRRSPLTMGLFAYATLYYLMSFVLTGLYEVNLRFYDLGFMVVAVLIVGRSKQMLAVSLFGLIISAWAVGIAMLQHIDSSAGSRLGIMMVEGRALGNPVSLGTPLALCFLALALDRGRWLQLRQNPIRRLLLTIPTFMLLALTTSRAAWLVTAGGILVALIVDGRSRGRLLLLIGLTAVILQVVLLSPYGDGMQAGLDRTFSDDRSTASRSSGRSDQWLVSYYALTASMGNMIYGYGPGLSPSVYARFSPEVPGVTYAVGWRAQLHSLYLQIAVETGLLGFLPFIFWLAVGFFKNIGAIRNNKLIFPLVCFLGYMLIITTVSGNDSVSGTFLGIGILATLHMPRPVIHLPKKGNTNMKGEVDHHLSKT